MAQKLENVSQVNQIFKGWGLNPGLELKRGIAFSKAIKFIHFTFLFRIL